MKHSLRRSRRAEGHAEYVIIVSMISVCIVAGLFNFGGEVKRALENAEICLTCEEKALADKSKKTLNEDGKTDEGENPDGAEGPADGAEKPPLPWYNDPSSTWYWLAQMMRWFGGAPHLWDFWFT